MNKYVKIGLYGIVIWLIPFLFAFLIFGLRETNRVLFESIMPVVLTLIVLIFSVLYFRKEDSNYFQNGIKIGIIWFLISIIIDLLLFLPESPMQLSIIDYFMDIGITYIIIIVIPIGFGFVLENKQ